MTDHKLSRASITKEKYFYFPSSGTPSIAGLVIGSPVIRLVEHEYGVQEFVRRDFNKFMTEIPNGVPDADLISAEDEREVFSFTIDLKDAAITTLNDAILEGFELGTTVAAGTQMLSTFGAKYDPSYALITPLANELMIANALDGEEVLVALNGATELSPETILDSNYRLDYLMWSRTDGGAPDPTNTSNTQSITSNRGMIRIDSTPALSNFQATANTEGFDANSTPHKLHVSVFVGRKPNF